MSRRGFHLAIIVMSGAKPPPPTAGMAYTSPSRTMVMMRRRRRRRRSRGEEVLSFLGRKKWTERTKWGDCRILARCTARWSSSIKRVSQSPQLIYDRSQSPLSTHSRRPPCPSVICFFQATKSRGIERTKYETSVVGVILYCERQMQVAEEPSSTISMRFTTAHIRYSSPIYTEMSSCFQGSSEIDSEVNRTDSLLESIEGGDSCVTPREEDERRIRLSRDERLHFYGRTERASDRPIVLPGRRRRRAVRSFPSFPNVYRTLAHSVRVAFFAPLHGYIPQPPSALLRLQQRSRVRRASVSVRSARPFRRAASKLLSEAKHAGSE